ncbi:MAG: 2Fe-2S iron-sulfur cluster binding domain-containing protein [Gammaproteobacteria bacterium]|nr:2Fe-2S iron-sulfur cluster binding domain-containing protein [Gammaproteobacteria bacterium]MCP5199480.1 2Fe-2S iron-sulfur cluster binding domain-containing protein [Gammaproteobacteria bacterium]
MGTIIATDRDGEVHRLAARQGLTLMEILRDGGLPIEAICGGQCICSTCHVYVDEPWAGQLEPRAADEQVMVEDTGSYQDNSRLACQVPYEEALDGLSLTLAPEY